MSEASFKIAQEFVRKGDIEQALTEYEKILQAEPNNLQICYELSELYARRGLISKVTEQYLRIADIYLGDTNLDKGVEACYRIIRIEPESIKAREKLIDIYNQMEDRDQVREQCFALSRICSMQGQSERALEFLQRGIEVDPDNLDARLELAIMNVKQGHIKEGIIQYKDVAQAFWEKGELGKASDTYKRVTVLQPDDTETHLALGTLYRELGQLEDAKNAFRYILRYELTHIKALTELGLVCQEKGEIDSAILAFKKIVDINPMKTEAKEKLGELYEIRGQLQEAIKQYYEAAEDFQKQEMNDKAIQMCERLLELDCKHSKALRLMKELGGYSRPQAMVQSPGQEELPGESEGLRNPKLSGRPVSGIMSIPRGGPPQGIGARPMSPVRGGGGARGGPLQQQSGATLRLNQGQTHRLGQVPFTSPGSTKPLTPLKTMHDAIPADSSENFSDIMSEREEFQEPPVHSMTSSARPVNRPPSAELEEPRRPLPVNEGPSSPVSSFEQGEPRRPGLIRREPSPYPTIEADESPERPKPKLINRLEAGRAQGKPPMLRTGSHPSTGSSGELQGKAENSYNSRPIPVVPDTVLSARSEERMEQPFLSEKQKIETKIGEIGDNTDDIKTIAFGDLVFEEEEEEISVQMDVAPAELPSPLPVKEIEEPPVVELKKEKVPESGSSAQTVPDIAVVEFYLEEEGPEVEDFSEVPSESSGVKIEDTPETKEKNIEYPDVVDNEFNRPSTSVLEKTIEKKEEKVTLPSAVKYVEAEPLRVYRKAIEENPGDISVRYEFINSLLDFGLLKEALSEYEELLKLDKNNFSYYQEIINIYNLISDEKELRKRYLELGELYRKNQKYEDALDIYQRMISLDSEDMEGREKMADILLLQNRKKEAIYQYVSVANMYTSNGRIKEVVEIYQKMLKIEPEALLTHIKLAETYARLEMKDKALQEYLLIAEIYMNKKLWNNAIEAYESIARLAPDHLDSHVKLSRLYMQHGMSNKAIEANLLIADIYINQNKLDLALEMAQNVIGAEPEHITAREKLIEVYRRKGQKERAIADCQNLAEIFLKKNDFDRAIEFYQKMLQIEPENNDPHYQLAELYETKGFTGKAIQEYIILAETHIRNSDYEEAVKSYRRAISMDQNNLEARYELGVLLAEKMNNLKGSLEEFEIIRRLNPTHMETIERLVFGYVELGRMQEAIQISKDLKNKEILGGIIGRFKESVEGNPDDFESRYNLGLIYKEFGDLENAIEQFQSLLKSQDRLLDAYNMLGLCFEQMGMGNLAINQFKKGLASSGYPDEAYQDLRYNLGLLHEKRGMLKEALSIYQEAFAVDIKYRDISQRIQQLEQKLRA